MDKRQDIITNFKILRQQESKNPFKVRAYTKVISQLEKSTAPIISVEDLSSIDGMGERLRAKAITILEQGYVDATKDDLIGDGHKKTVAIEEFVKVMSIGNVKAKSLVNEHGIFTIDDLRARVQDDPGLLNDKQKLGLKYHEDFVKRIPRKEMDKHASIVKELAAAIDTAAAISCEIVGSYRRGAADSGDIDVLITNNSGDSSCLTKVVEELRKRKYLADDFAYGKEKYMGVCKLPYHKSFRRIDIMYIDPAQYVFALLYFTGSQEFNIEMRNWALIKGYSMSEHGLKKTADGSMLDMFFKSEEAVFNFLGLEYVTPTERKKGMIRAIVCDISGLS